MPIYCENHRAVVMDRGGTRLLGNLDSLVRVRWNRVRDDFSDANVEIVNPSKSCSTVLEDAHPNRHELVIFRGDERVWEGPLTRIARHKQTYQMEARDVTRYVKMTVNHAEYDNSNRWDPDEDDPAKVFLTQQASIVDRALNMLNGELSRKEALTPPINVLPYLTAIRATDINDERRTTRRALAYSISVFDDIDEMAATGGLDYTVVGRRIILWDNRLVIGRTAPITEADIVGEVVVTSYGMDAFTRAFTTGEDGAYGVYPPLAAGNDPFYGEWEYIEDMFDEDSPEPPTQAALDRGAEMNMTGKNPVPTLVRIPENSKLNMNGTLSMRDLVPGVIVPVRAEVTGRPIIQELKLNRVAVEEAEGSEDVLITLGPPAGSVLT